MAEMVSSAVVQETVSQILSGLVQKYEEKEESNANRNLERLEMANIKLEAALETSEKWQITDASLLRWRRKLKRAAQDNFYFSVMLQLSETTDIVGIAIKCLQLFTPLFKSTVEIIRNKLIQLPTQDLSWVPHVDSRQKEHWDNLHSFRTQWFRPNPLRCKHLDQHELRCSSNIDTSKLPDVSLEPVVEVNLQCHVSLSGGNISVQGSQHLISGLLFMPHGSSEDLLPADKSSAIAVIDGEEKRCLHTVITLEQLEEIMLRKAIDHFRQNAEATVYQMLWKSKHNTAYIQVEKASTKMQSTGKLIRGARNGNMSRQQVQACVIPHFLNMWVAQAPIWLQGSIVNWVQREAPEILDHHVTWINDGKREK